MTIDPDGCAPVSGNRSVDAISQTSVEPAPVYQWALHNLHQPLTVDQLARQAGMSRRTLIRRFHTDTGRPPMRWLLDARLGLARELLESTSLTVEAVARRCGLGTPANFRTQFKAHIGVPPSTYRETFSPVPGAGP